MLNLTILLLNCTPKQSPEISNTDALGQLVTDQYKRHECQINQIRVADYLTQSGELLEPGSSNSSKPENKPDQFPLQAIQSAHILIIGVPVTQGMRSPVYQYLMRYLRQKNLTHADSITGQSLLYNKVFGVLVVSDASSGRHPIAQISDDLNQLGGTAPPHNTVTWMQPMDTETEFIEANGQHSLTVNREARLLVENTMAIAHLLQRSPLTTNLRQITETARSIAKAAVPETATLLTPKVITTNDSASNSPDNPTIYYRHLTKRIWTVMQEGIRRGFEFKVLSLEDRTYQAERDGKGFIYKIYPGHFSFRIKYKDYDYEQSKSKKLSMMQQDGLSVPLSYGTFKSVIDIPFEKLTYPIVAKPESGSLSQNVFPNLQSLDQLKVAAAMIEASGAEIKLESHINGRDYRVLIINHQYAGCVERRPANVTGDGIHTIRQLFHLRNQEAGRGDRYEAHTTLHQLVFDQTSRSLLDQAGYTLETVLPLGEMFYLQTKITASTGSDYVDCTDQLHPSIVQQCIDFSHQYSTLTLGFDLITTDISRPLIETGGAFNEYNFIPYVDLHENCNIGQKRPVCRLLWDYIEKHADRIVTAEFQPF
ncbi:MAG: hypothetical protein F6K30_13330 [Cyanothece sp. SIO2G6]|nr:hypothetical protein [Cyanothece sp. SIO2G6]